MNIGGLDRRITIQEQSTTVNDYGERAITWGTYAIVWASLERVRGASEKNSGEQVVSVQQVVFNIRNSSQVNELSGAHRVSYGGNIYEVLGVQEVGRNEQLRVVTSLILS